MADAYGNPTSGGGTGSSNVQIINDLLDVAVNPGTFTDSDYAFFTPVTDSTLTIGDMSGTWDTKLTTISVRDVENDLYIRAAAYRYRIFHKEVQNGINWILIPKTIGNGNISGWTLIKTAAPMSEFGTQTGAAVTLSQPWTVEPLTMTEFTNPTSRLEYGLPFKATTQYNSFNVYKNKAWDLPKVETGHFLAWDSELDAWKPVRGVEKSEYDSDYWQLRLQKGHFSAYGDQFTDFPEEPGRIYLWNAINDSVANWGIRVLTHAGVVSLPYEYKTYTDWESNVGVGNPDSDIQYDTGAPNKLYTNSENNSLWLRTAAMRRWERITFDFGANCYRDLTTAQLSPLVSYTNNPVGFTFCYFADKSKSGNGASLGLAMVTAGLYDAPVYRSVKNLVSYASEAAVIAHYNPSTDPSSFPYYEAVHVYDGGAGVFESKFGYVNRNGSFGSNELWNFDDLTADITQPVVTQAEINADIWADGSTLYLKSKKSLYVRVVDDSDGLGTWNKISGDILRSEYDSDLAALRAEIRNEDSDQLLSNLFDVRAIDSDNTVLLTDNTTLVYDSESAEWVPTKFHLSAMKDLKLIALGEGDIIAWDSDQESWVNRIKPEMYSSMLQVENYTVGVTGEDKFFLTHQPIGDVQMSRNGVELDITAFEYYDSEVAVKYKPAGNFGDILEVGDTIAITYTWVTVSRTSRLGNLLDIDNKALIAEHGDMLLWDSDSELWKPANLSPSQMRVETFTAKFGQDKFQLQEAASGEVLFTRNGIAIPGDAITLSTDGRTVYYDSDLNENSIIQDSDIINIQYIGTEPIRGWAPTSLTNLGDVKIIGEKTDGMILSYNQTDEMWDVLKPEYKDSDGDFLSVIERTVARNAGSFLTQDLIYNETDRKMEYRQRWHHELKPVGVLTLGLNAWIPFTQTYMDGVYVSVVNAPSANIPREFGYSYVVEADLAFKAYLSSASGWCVEYDVCSYAPDANITVYGKGRSCSADYTGTKNHMPARFVYTYTDSGNNTQNIYNSRIAIRIKNIEFTGTSGNLTTDNDYGYFSIKKIR